MRWLILLTSLVAVTQMHAAGASLPVIRNIGVVPVKADVTDARLSRMIPDIADNFSRAVRNVAKFRVVHDQLVADYYGSAEGRARLESEFEVDGLVSLQVQQYDDMVHFSIRMTDARLSNYLFEQEHKTLSWVLGATEKDVADFTDLFVYRVFNRIPVDMVVTSLQGNYITLSAGTDRNLAEGDVLPIRRVFITDTHPVHGSWTQFETKVLGKVRLIQVNRHSAVGKYIELAYEDAIKVGDGALSKRMDARTAFKKNTGGEVIFDTPSGNPILTAKPKKPIRLASKENPPPIVAEASEPEEDDPGLEEVSAEEEGSAPDILAEYFSEFYMGAGLNLWSTSGNASSQAKVPLWLVNDLEAYGYMDLGGGAIADPKFRLQLGSAGSNSYTGFGLSGGYLVPIDMEIPTVRKFYAGGGAAYDTLGVSGGKFGGYDLLKFYGSVLAMGDLEAMGWDWFGRFDLELYGSGKVGTRGAKKKVKSLFGWLVSGGAFMPGRPGELEWGGSLSLGSEAINIGSTQNFSTFKLAALARLRF